MARWMMPQSCSARLQALALLIWPPMTATMLARSMRLMPHQFLEETHHLEALQLLLQNCAALAIKPVQREAVLGDIKANGMNAPDANGGGDS